MAFMGSLQVFLPDFPRQSPPNTHELVANARIKHPALLTTNPSKPGGDFEYTPLPLAEPADLLPDPAKPLRAARWYFKAASRQEVLDLFKTSGLTHEQRETLLDPESWEVASNGFNVFPKPKVLLEMSPTARERIYSVLDDYPANPTQCNPFRFRPAGFEDWLVQTGLGREQQDLVRKLTYRQGESLCFCDAALVQGLFPRDDFKRLVKALYGERTFLMRIRLTPETDIDGLIRYWGQTSHARAMRPLLESMAQIPGGTSVNVSYFLPPFARARLYTYADPTADPGASQQNCYWTAMNFFNEKPDDRFLDLTCVRRVLARDYQPASGSAQFGDLMTVEDGKGRLLHMCVYLADDVVFTKNGRDSIDPWVLMKIPDMMACYQTKEPAHFAFFRSKKA